MEDFIPKFKLLQLVSYVTDLLMISLEMDEEVKEPKVRNVWHLLILSAIVFIILFSFIKIFLLSLIKESIIIIYYYRLFSILCIIYFLVIVAFATFRHYKYLFKTGKDLDFSIIIIFYIAFVLFFGSVYNEIYMIKPSLYAMKDALFQPTQHL